MKKQLLSVLAFATLLSSVFVGTAHAAAASFTLSPASGTYAQNSSFTVGVYENGTNVNVVTAKLTFDADKLTCVSVGGSSAFPNNVAASCGNGTVTISRYTPMDADGNPTTVSGNQLVGSIIFTAKATGTALVKFAAGSQIASNGAQTWDGNTNGGSYTLTAPATPGRGSDTPTTPANPGSTPSNTGNATTKKSTGPTTVATNGSVAGDETTAAETPATTDTKKDTTKKSDTKKDDSKDDKNSSSAWFWVLALVAIVAGALAGRKYAALKKKAPAEKAAPVVASKPAAKKNVKKNSKKTSRS